MLILLISLAALLSAARICVPAALGVRKIQRLAATADECAIPRPSVSIIVCALNEEAFIESTTRALLAIDYPNLEIILVNDRSTDATGDIMDRMAAIDGRVRVIHVEELPPGWFGKNHAMHLGASQSSAELILFTDADVRFMPDTLTCAVNMLQRDGLDHLTLLPRLSAPSAALRMLMVGLFAGFFAVYRPWDIPVSRRCSAGIGAFNLIRREAYLVVGGHKSIRLDILDDLSLGRIIKEAGCSQRLAFADRLLQSQWYPNVCATWRGLQKNAFAFFGFSIAFLARATLLTLLVRVWPWIALVIGDSPARLAALLALACQGQLGVEVAKLHGWRWRCFWFAPVMAIVEIAIWWSSAWRFLSRRGIVWRGTAYRVSN